VPVLARVGEPDRLAVFDDVGQDLLDGEPIYACSREIGTSRVYVPGLWLLGLRDGEHSPGGGHALELAFTSVHEFDSGSGD